MDPFIGNILKTGLTQTCDRGCWENTCERSFRKLHYFNFADAASGPRPRRSCDPVTSYLKRTFVHFQTGLGELIWKNLAGDLWAPDPALEFLLYFWEWGGSRTPHFCWSAQLDEARHTSRQGSFIIPGTFPANPSFPCSILHYYFTLVWCVWLNGC